MRDKKDIPVLVAEIKDELTKLDHLLEKLSLQKGVTTNEERLESSALRLHNFYTGCERIFKLIASDVNDSVPESPDWHKRLLIQASLDVERVRPAVISTEVREVLEELLAFRHLVRSIYGHELDPERVQNLIKKTLALYPKLDRDLGQFTDYLMELYESI